MRLRAFDDNDGQHHSYSTPLTMNMHYMMMNDDELRWNECGLV